MSVLAEEEKLEELKNTANKEFTVALINWKDASTLEQDKKRQVERSDEELALTELLYTEGMGAQIDLLNAQTDNQQVRTEYLSAIGEMYTALVALKRAAGDYAPNEHGSWKEAVSCLALQYVVRSKAYEVIISLSAGNHRFVCHFGRRPNRPVFKYDFIYLIARVRKPTLNLELPFSTVVEQQQQVVSFTQRVDILRCDICSEL